MRLLILSDLHLEFRAPQPGHVCGACGTRFGLGKLHDGGTWHMGQCGVCGKTTGITSPDDFGQLGNDWNLGLPDPSAYDIVVLAGDIHGHTHAIHWAARTFLKPVVYVPGNHEFYGANYHGLLAELRRCAAEYSHVHLMDNNAIEIDGVRILGTMLWDGLHAIRKRSRYSRAVSARCQAWHSGFRSYPLHWRQFAHAGRHRAPAS